MAARHNGVKLLLCYKQRLTSNVYVFTKGASQFQLVQTLMLDAELCYHLS